MRTQIVYGPAFPILKVYAEPGEKVTVQAGNYMLSKGEIDIETKTYGIGKALKRKLLGGVFLFFNTIKAKTPAEIWISPLFIGDMVEVDLNGSLYVQDAAYVAHTGDISVSTKYLGVHGLLGEGELFWLKIEGHGKVFLSAFGALEKVELGSGEKMTVDNYHFLGMDPSIDWKIRKFGSWKSFFFGGEGFVFELKGPGRVWLQTRSLQSLVMRQTEQEIGESVTDNAGSIIKGLLKGLGDLSRG